MTAHDRYADEVARMVLAVVQEVRRVTKPREPEPTGIRIAPKDREFVERRAS